LIKDEDRDGVMLRRSYIGVRDENERKSGECIKGQTRKW